MLRIGIDIGGTFTDFVVHDPETGRITTFKILSDPNNPARTVLQGLDQIDTGTVSTNHPRFDCSNQCFIGEKRCSHRH